MHAGITAIGLRLAVIENNLPLVRPVLGQDGRDEDIEEIANVIRQMGRLEIPILCYNFMPSGNWNRTSVEVPERGGALVSAFDANEMESVSTLLADGTSRDSETAAEDRVPADRLWENLEYFLELACCRLPKRKGSPGLSSRRSAHVTFSRLRSDHDLTRGL